MSATSIAEIRAREIIDSRGNPTIEVDVQLDGGALGRAAVPSGASTGVHEALELRDGDPQPLRRQGRLKRRRQRQRPDRRGAPGRRRDRAIRARRAADRARRHREQVQARRQRDARRIARRRARRRRGGRRRRSIAISNPDASVMPVPMMNVINGGKHADSSVDMQEFMIVPLGAPTYRRSDAHGRRGLPRAGRRAEEAWAIDQRRRRGRLRPQSAQQRGADRSDPRSDREGRLSSRRRCRARARPGLQRVLRRRPLRVCALGQEGARLGSRWSDFMRDLGRPLPNRLDRGRAGRRRLGGMANADARTRREAYNSSATTSSSPIRNAWSAASASTRPTRS